MNRNDRGFTLIEIIVVLVLISIIAATVFGRSITTGQINLAGETAKIRNHIRYPQSKAMKRNEIWGFSSDGSDPTSYWIFSGTDPSANQRVLPGEDQAVITLPSPALAMDGFTVFFDRYGKPYLNYPSTPVSGELSETVSASGGGSRTIKILEETGLIK